ncbi:MAG: lipopolysaccharide kinase InaA family protein [Desulfuromonas sp.]|nr:lipopolysaccharide kinase InaA family protein [Desulfuromonas sp.]
MHTNTIYTHPQWQDILAANNLATFEQLWNVQLQAVDEGNQGRGHKGWSVVAIHRLTSPTGPSKRVIIKRQSNYRSRTLSHPLRGIATFEKEYNFIRRYAQLGVPSTQAIYCATRMHNGDLQAILVTEYLEDYRSLEDILDTLPHQDGDEACKQQRRAIIANVAQLVAKLHNSGLEHRCLFPKHIFVPNDLHQQACLIDLEKTREKPWSRWRRIRDLTALRRRTTQLTTRDNILFLRTYLGINHLNSEAKKLWQQVETRRTKHKSG